MILKIDLTVHEYLVVLGALKNFVFDANDPKSDVVAGAGVESAAAMKKAAETAFEKFRGITGVDADFLNDSDQEVERICKLFYGIEHF